MQFPLWLTEQLQSERLASAALPPLRWWRRSPRRLEAAPGAAAQMWRSSSRQLSELGSGAETEDDSMFQGLWDLDVLNSQRTPFKWEHLVALIIVLLSIVTGRWMYDGFFRLLR